MTGEHTERALSGPSQTVDATVASPGSSATRIIVTFGDTVALADVSLVAPAGQVAAVVGGDGAGKTTLLRCLAGLVRPDSGTISKPAKERVGYFPAKSGIYPDLTVIENLDFRAQSYGVPTGLARERSAELIDRAGLGGARDRLAGQLSGGMLQKLGVIASIIQRPELLILDEPTTGVDPVSRSGLWWLIARAAADGCSVVLATTYLDEAERCQSVLVLDSGVTLASGTPDEIIAAMPGALRRSAERPTGAAGQLAWRRGGQWRVWEPNDSAAMIGGSGAAHSNGNGFIQPDLQDAVTVAALAREMGGGAR